MRSNCAELINLMQSTENTMCPSLPQGGACNPSRTGSLGSPRPGLCGPGHCPGQDLPGEPSPAVCGAGRAAPAEPKPREAAEPPSREPPLEWWPCQGQLRPAASPAPVQLLNQWAVYTEGITPAGMGTPLPCPPFKSYSCFDFI